MSVTARRFSPLLIAVVISLSLAGCAKRLVLPISNTARAKAAQVDFSLLAEMARKAGLAYESNGKIQSAYGPGVIVRKDSGSFGQFFLITDETRKTQTLAIRGTNNKYDLGRDLRVRKEKHGGVSYHRGFYAPTIRLYAVLRGFLKKDPAGGAPYPLTITGHSLGGAMGLVLYKHLTENGYAPDQIELFINGGEGHNQERVSGL